jgi:hypothetical protein
MIVAGVAVPKIAAGLVPEQTELTGDQSTFGQARQALLKALDGQICFSEAEKNQAPLMDI